ncbi:MAG: tetratricopeptide repeat protein [Planctomycetota bacterium]|nr:tetratricopeptide repeat protein [Planctomycetota bacterium]
MTSPRRSTRARFALLALSAVIIAAPLGCARSDRAEAKPAPAVPPRNLVLAQEKAKQAQAAKKPERAIALYQEALSAFPEFSAAWNNLGVLLLQQDRYLEAAEAFAQAAEQGQADPRGLYNLGLVWDRRNWPEQALELYLRALQRDPDYLPALRGAIRAERTLGRAEEETLERIRRALLRDRDDQWLEYFELQRSRVENLLRERRLSMYASPPRDSAQPAERPKTAPQTPSDPSQRP